MGLVCDAMLAYRKTLGTKRFAQDLTGARETPKRGTKVSLRALYSRPIRIYTPAQRCEPGNCTQLHAANRCEQRHLPAKGQTTRDDHAPAQEARRPQNRRQEA
jgi:hypothetical protein